MVDIIKRLIDANRWANLAVLKALPDGEGEAQSMMAHVLEGERVYLNRIQGCDDDAPSLPATTKELRAMAAQLADRYEQYLRTVSGEELARRLAPTGLPTQTDVANVLMHVVTHSWHHRAVVCRMLREAGIEPPRVGYMYHVLTEIETK